MIEKRGLLNKVFCAAIMVLGSLTIICIIAMSFSNFGRFVVACRFADRNFPTFSGQFALSAQEVKSITVNRTWKFKRSRYDFSEELSRFGTGFYYIQNQNVPRPFLYALSGDRFCTELPRGSFSFRSNAYMQKIVKFKNGYALVDFDRDKVQIHYEPFRSY